jgi:hypothetical protein
MKLTTFTYHGTTRPGVVIGDEDLFDAATVPDLPQDMIGLLKAGAPALDRLLEPGDIISTGTCTRLWPFHPVEASWSRRISHSVR